MNPYKLIGEPMLKMIIEFLADTILTYVNTFQDPRVNTTTTFMFARKFKMKCVTALFTKNILSKLQYSPLSRYFVRSSVDNQVSDNIKAEYTSTSLSTVKLLNNQLKEPRKLVLIPWRSMSALPIVPMEDIINQI